MKASDAMRLSCDKIKDVCPELWELVYPRRYIRPSGFQDPRWSAINAETALGLSRGMMGERSDDTHGVLAAIGLKLIDSGMPVYFLDSKFAQAVWLTKLPENFTFNDIDNWPLEAVSVFLPESFSLSAFGRNVGIVDIVKLEKGDLPESCTGMLSKRRLDLLGVHPELIGTGVDVLEPQILVGCSVFDSDKVPLNIVVKLPPTEQVSTLKDRRVDSSIESEDIKFGNYPDSDRVQTSYGEDSHICEQSVLFAVKLLLVLAATVRDNISQSRLIRTEKRDYKGRLDREALWSPNIIGSGYTPPSEASSGLGSHASPRTHWRRGHFTHQAHGPGFSKRKLIWIKPVIVNPPSL